MHYLAGPAANLEAVANELQEVRERVNAVAVFLPPFAALISFLRHKAEHGELNHYFFASIEVYARVKAIQAPAYQYTFIAFVERVTAFRVMRGTRFPGLGCQRRAKRVLA